MARIMSCFPWDESRETLEVALSERDLVTLLGLIYTRGGPKAIVTRDVPVEFAHCRISVQWGEQAQMRFSDRQFVVFGETEVPLFMVDLVPDIDENLQPAPGHADSEHRSREGHRA